MRVLIAALAALCLAACTTAQMPKPEPGAVQVTMTVPPAVAAKVKPYCKQLRSGAVAAPIVVAIVKHFVTLPAWATTSEAGAVSLINQICKET